MGVRSYQRAKLRGHNDDVLLFWGGSYLQHLLLQNKNVTDPRPQLVIKDLFLTLEIIKMCITGKPNLWLNIIIPV